MAETAVGTVGGRFVVMRTLGQGAFGHTFLATDLANQRPVAIKLLDTRGRNDVKAYELFKREADVLRGIRHHGIPEVYETLQDFWYGVPATFLVMEYIEGMSLAALIEEKQTLDASQVVHLFLELVGVLDYLHGRVPPILHRDIKPANIIIRPNGFPALVDFGSVRRVYMAPDESGSTIAGTYGYMPYEQYMGQASPSSDLYAVAATFLHLLTGRPPRDFMNDEGRIEVPDTLPCEPRLRLAIARMLRPSPVERFASARHVRHALIADTTGGRIAVTSSVRHSVQAPDDITQALHALPPAPRKLAGDTKQLMRASAPSALRLMTASEKGENWTFVGVVGIGLFSVATAGVLPLVFWNMASARRRRLKRFFRDGVPATAEVTKIELEKTAFDEKLARVGYEFYVDGKMYRDADSVLPVIAERWRPGDQVAILYLPEAGCDSVIIAVE